MYDLCYKHGMPFPCPKCNTGTNEGFLATVDNSHIYEIMRLEEKLKDCMAEKLELIEKLTQIDKVINNNFLDK